MIIQRCRPTSHCFPAALHHIYCDLSSCCAHGEKLFKLKAAKKGYSKPIIVMTLSLSRRDRYMFEVTIHEHVIVNMQF